MVTTQKNCWVWLMSRFEDRSVEVMQVEKEKVTWSAQAAVTNTEELVAQTADVHLSEFWRLNI